MRGVPVTASICAGAASPDPLSTACQCPAVCAPAGSSASAMKFARAVVVGPSSMVVVIASF
jgi:hypothetical protein